MEWMRVVHLALLLVEMKAASMEQMKVVQMVWRKAEKLVGLMVPW